MSVLDPYRDILERWRHEAGRKPTRRELEAVHATGQCRVGAKGTFAVAMALRPEGTTNVQMTVALGDTYRGKIMALLHNGTAVKVPMPKQCTHLVLKLVLINAADNDNIK